MQSLAYPHTRWEYTRRNTSKSTVMSESDLNYLGEEGWELTSIIDGMYDRYYYFKRRKIN